MAERMKRKMTKKYGERGKAKPLGAYYSGGPMGPEAMARHGQEIGGLAQKGARSIAPLLSSLGSAVSKGLGLAGAIFYSPSIGQGSYRRPHPSELNLFGSKKISETTYLDKKYGKKKRYKRKKTVKKKLKKMQE